MEDYLGVEIDKQIEDLISEGGYSDIGKVIDTGWEKTKNDTFKVWSLLYEAREEDALKYRQSHPMARDKAISLYICHKQNLNEAFEGILHMCFTRTERQRLLTDALTLSAKIPDLELAKKIIAIEPSIAKYRKQEALTEAAKSGNTDIVKLLCENGADPNANGDIALKESIINENTELIKYLVKTSNFHDLSYHFLDTEMCQKAKSQAFMALLSCDVYLEGNHHQLTKSLNLALKLLRPKTQKSEMQSVMKLYPLESLSSLEQGGEGELRELAGAEIKRRKSVEIGANIQARFKNDLTFEF
jgi:hypothetical protein